MTTRDGVRICVRPLRADDRQLQVAFVDSLSDRSRYFRFFGPLKGLPAHLLDQLMEVDYERRMAVAATIERTSIEQFIGIAHYAGTDRADEVEAAVAVADAWQRRGVASLLLSELTRFARRRGIRHFTGSVLPDNDRMIGLARSLDFQIRFDLMRCLFTTSCDLASARS